MKELGYMEGSMRKEPQGKQHYSWLGIEVKSEFLVEEEGEKEPKIEDFEKEWEKGRMPDKFKDVMSDGEITALAAWLYTFKNTAVDTPIPVKKK